MKLENSYDIKEKPVEVKGTEQVQTDTDKLLGDMFEEQTVVFGEKKRQDNKQKLRFGKLNQQDRDLAVRLNLVPENYKAAAFSRDAIVSKIQADWERVNKLNFNLLYNFESYINMCTRILNCIRAGQLPPRSYLIAAPIGFGKTDFVYECIMTLNKNGYKVTNYTPLSELKIIRKAGNSEVGKFNYIDYINSECLFVSFGKEAKEELHELEHLLAIRNVKGLTTIATTENKFEYYTNNTDKSVQNAWKGIREHDEEENLYSRLWFVETHYHEEHRLDAAELKIDESTGIVLET